MMESIWDGLPRGEPFIAYFWLVLPKLYEKVIKGNYMWHTSMILISATIKKIHEGSYMPLLVGETNVH